jgi:hypothetical protein
MQDDLQQQLDTEGLYMPIIGVDNRGDKDKRIHSLDSLIHRGTIQFSLSHKTLLDQFRFFPNGLHDDGPDALQMIVSNIEIAPHIWKNPVSITQRRTESRELHGIPDVRDVNYPQVHKEVKDRFVPDPNDY